EAAGVAAPAAEEPARRRGLLPPLLAVPDERQRHEQAGIGDALKEETDRPRIVIRRRLLEPEGEAEVEERLFGDGAPPFRERVAKGDELGGVAGQRAIVRDERGKPAIVKRRRCRRRRARSGPAQQT